jgi:hypothetical protein
MGLAPNVSVGKQCFALAALALQLNFGHKPIISLLTPPVDGSSPIDPPHPAPPRPNLAMSMVVELGRYTITLLAEG